MAYNNQDPRNQRGGGRGMSFQLSNGVSFCLAIGEVVDSELKISQMACCKQDFNIDCLSWFVVSCNNAVCIPSPIIVTLSSSILISAYSAFPSVILHSRCSSAEIFIVVVVWRIRKPKSPHTVTSCWLLHVTMTVHLT